LYSHLTLNGVQVTIGQTVLAGDVIGMSGDTGNTGGLPHLHFSLHPCGALPGLPGTGNCPSVPANFRNTTANPDGLVAGLFYQALEF
jgi:murein DD-endopeptidase MepM/ murein hydrolase activator NlpD